MQHYSTLFASTYGSSTYNSSTYNGATSTSTGSSSGSSSSAGGVLTNTGFDIAAAVTLACAIVFLSLAARFWKRPRKHSPEPSEISPKQ